ncbi:peptide/nickel transport system substrate-binding protein [Sulfobacillus thermosulfidooxidans DSM 9293]|uniref:Peptide/nickel transport system substrate-binding protein n=1 Tax=Sulfobacillus thermosulfidooxidans (strain DSM 9293 / VKM B-1269 / AT-1) TaxID=929705 RepID=A0A1W1WCD7_SULTA|nr:peptide ABC transporter substrate-binding protein [Sulfobacillus thermosulfidooxidans]SMC03885.1 peptide/nickel transport system substrate-binding protein [Sulfobacillus thermosulfidooxidans DSM 9293]
MKNNRRHMSLWGAGTVMALAPLLLAGCGSSSTNASSSPSSTSSSPPAASATTTALKPVKGGTIIQALGPLVSINWYLPLRPVAYNSLYDAWAASLMYKGLFHIAPNGKIDFSRSIASSITWNKSGTVYTVKMNPKWHWSDGTPVTANDVAFTWKLIQAASAPNAPAPWPYAGADSGGVPQLIKSFRVLNSHEFQITLTQPVNQMWFEYDGLSDFMPLPEQAWNRYPNNVDQELSYLASNGTNVNFFKVVDGPFRLTNAIQNVSWTFTPNAHYDGHKPYINKFVLAYETSETSEVNGLQTGTVQVGYLPLSMYDKRNELTNDTLVPSYGYSIARTILNFRSPSVGSILRQLPVRQAMQMGIDQQAIIDALYNGMGVPGTGPVPLHPKTFLAPQLIHPLYNYNIPAAIHLLEKNGWHMVNGVMTNNKGQKLEFNVEYDAGSSTTLAMVQILQQDWAKEGIKVSLTPLPFATMLQYQHQPTKWEIQTGLGWSYGGSYPTGGGMYETNGGYNFYGYSNPTMNTLIAATHAPQPSAAASQKALDAYELFAAKHLPNLWMPVPEGLSEVAKNVHGVRSSANHFTDSISPQYWWISP